MTKEQKIAMLEMCLSELDKYASACIWIGDDCDGIIDKILEIDKKIERLSGVQSSDNDSVSMRRVLK